MFIGKEPDIIIGRKKERKEREEENSKNREKIEIREKERGFYTKRAKAYAAAKGERTDDNYYNMNVYNVHYMQSACLSSGVSRSLHVPLHLYIGLI